MNTAENPLMDLLIDIALLDSTAARTALARWEAAAYAGPVILNSDDGLPYLAAQLN